MASMGFESLIDYNKTTPECSFVKASKQVFECGKLNARSASENQIWRNTKKTGQCIPLCLLLCLRQEMEEKNSKDDLKTEVCDSPTIH